MVYRVPNNAAARPSSTVRRLLQFGQRLSDSERARSNVERRLIFIVAEAELQQKWNFDFANCRPLPGRFTWTPQQPGDMVSSVDLQTPPCHVMSPVYVHTPSLHVTSRSIIVSDLQYDLIQDGDTISRRELIHSSDVSLVNDLTLESDTTISPLILQPPLSAVDLNLTAGDVTIATTLEEMGGCNHNG